MSDRNITEKGAAPSGVLQILTLFVVVLLAVPSRLVVRQIGGAGTPAELMGIGLAIWWAVMRIARPRARALQPVRVAATIFLGCVLISYIVAATRPIDPDEMRAADMGALAVVAWLGVLLVVGDGPTDRSRLDTLLRRLTIGGGMLASLGILQFITGDPFTNYIHIPGLSENNDLTSVLSRDGLFRPAGTALHPIEFGAVLTTILPLALHYAIVDRHRGPVARWFPVGAIAVAVPISISRSAIISAIVVLLLTIPTWPPARRRASVAVLAVLACCGYAASPGLVRTLTQLFSGISNDPSAQSRTGSYGLAWDFIARTPIFGRGFRTFLPSYRILDNQYLGVMIDMGFVGLASLLALFITGFVAARRVRRMSDDEDVRSLAQALAASVAASAWSFAVFDAFAFPMATTLLFMVLGAVDCLRRVSLPARRAGSSPTADTGTRPRELV